MVCNLSESSLSENTFTLSLCSIGHLTACGIPGSKSHSLRTWMSCISLLNVILVPLRVLRQLHLEYLFLLFPLGVNFMRVCLGLDFSFIPSAWNLVHLILWELIPFFTSRLFSYYYFFLSFLCSHYRVFSEESKPVTDTCSEISATLFS